MNYREYTKEEEKWIKSFERVMKKAPDSLFLFVASGSVTIMPLNEKGKRYTIYSFPNEEMDCTDKYITVDTRMDCDGGDW